MKILFLDCDGVLNNCYTTDRYTKVGFSGGLRGLDTDKCDLIRQLFRDIPDLRLVVSSTWRKDIGMMGYLCRRLSPEYIDAYIGITPVTHRSRHEDIQEWLNRNDNSINPITNICILDDDFRNGILCDYQVLTYEMEGLQPKQIDDIKAMLNKPYTFNPNQTSNSAMAKIAKQL